jgi:hypothetical protein
MRAVCGCGESAFLTRDFRSARPYLFCRRVFITNGGPEAVSLGGEDLLRPVPVAYGPSHLQLGPVGSTLLTVTQHATASVRLWVLVATRAEAFSAPILLS